MLNFGLFGEGVRVFGGEKSSGWLVFFEEFMFRFKLLLV